MRPSFVCHTRTVLSLPPDTPSSPPGATSIDSTERCIDRQMSQLLTAGHEQQTCGVPRWLGWICFHVDDGACRTPLFSLWLLGARVSCLFCTSSAGVVSRVESAGVHDDVVVPSTPLRPSAGHSRTLRRCPASTPSHHRRAPSLPLHARAVRRCVRLNNQRCSDVGGAPEGRKETQKEPGSFS
jgi:hypothetical protein